jgi:hypothetical protein
MSLIARAARMKWVIEVCRLVDMNGNEAVVPEPPTALQGNQSWRCRRAVNTMRSSLKTIRDRVELNQHWYWALRENHIPCPMWFVDKVDRGITAAYAKSCRREEEVLRLVCEWVARNDRPII